LPQRARPRGLDHDVRTQQQLAQLCTRDRQIEIERDAGFAGVQQVVEAARRIAHAVGPAAAFHLDHPRAHHLQQMGTQGPGPEGGQIDHQRRAAVFPAPMTADVELTAPGPSGSVLGFQRRQRQSEQAAAFDTLRHAARLESRRNRGPIRNRACFQPGGQHCPIGGARKVDGKPTVGGLQQATTAAGGNVASAPVCCERRALS
jgi:hypothetical protein